MENSEILVWPIFFIRELKEKEKQKEQTGFRQLTMIEAETKVKVWDIDDPRVTRIHKLVVYGCTLVGKIS